MVWQKRGGQVVEREGVVGILGQGQAQQPAVAVHLGSLAGWVIVAATAGRGMPLLFGGLDNGFFNVA